MTHRIPRLLARAPIPLYRAGLGLLLGRRLVMIEHRGRVSGLRRYVVLEVLEHDPEGLVVVSGYGRRAQWYRNVLAHPGVRVWTGIRRGVPAEATAVPVAEVPRQLEEYRDRHPRAAKALGRTLELPDLQRDGPLPTDVGARLPLVRIEFAPSWNRT
jgi:deazaflavin-dependent oxidoreductase (nitroreductase family)